MSNRAALSGSLAELPLDALLAFVSTPAHSGVVELDGAAPGLIVIDRGAITLALADAGPSLPQVIIGSTLATSDVWDRAHRSSLKGQGIAAALIDEGVDGALLEEVLREQTIGALFEFLLPSETSFAFIPGATHAIGDRFRYDPASLLADAAGRVEAWKTIAESIPSTAVVLRLTRDLPTPTATITAGDWRVLCRVDGRTSVADLIRDLGMSAFTVCGVLHQLMQAGCVEVIA